MSRPPRSRRETESLESVQAKMEEHFNNMRYYEAQQLYLTLFNRLSARENWNDAIELMRSGALKLLEHKEGNAGGQLALKLIESYKKSNTTPSPDIVQTLLNIFQQFPDDAKDARVSFMKEAISFTTTGPNPQGDPSLHYALAVYLSKVEDHGGAQRHWLRSERPQEHVQELISWSQKGFLGERDLFLARAVLQYAALENLRDANLVFNVYCDFYRSQPDPEQAKAIDTPLVHFIRFLLATLERDAAPLFEVLRQKYSASLARDSSFSAYLDKIGELYYKIKPPAGMLDELMNLMK